MKKSVPRNKECCRMQELRELQDYLMDKCQITRPIATTFKSVQCGRASYHTRKITMPIWIFDYSTEYQWCYMIHEVLHFILWDKMQYGGHGDVFKNWERNLLKEFGLSVTYKKAYIKTLNSSYNGDSYKML